MKWSVYKIEKHGAKPEMIALGYVNASNHPNALSAAWKKWPRRVDTSQVQAGFSVRAYKDDPYELGRKQASIPPISIAHENPPK